MKNTILIKRHPSVQLAHLYEHLFLIKANELMNQRGFFKWVDYTLNGTTFDRGGVISVDFKAYNNAAADSLADILQIRIDDDEPLTIRSLMQIHAEEVYELKAGSLKAIRKQLRDIDSAEWQSLDALIVLNTKDVKRASMPLHLTKNESSPPITTKVALEFHQEPAADNLLSYALFTIVARVILLTATYNTAKETGSYSYQLYTQLSGKRVVAELLTADRFRAHKPSLEGIVKQIQDTVSTMRCHDVFRRLATDLRNTSYYDNGAQAPDYEQILNDLGLLVGTEGWKTVNEERIDDVLRQMSIRVGRSRNNLQAPLSDSKAT